MPTVTLFDPDTGRTRRVLARIVEPAQVVSLGEQMELYARRLGRRFNPLSVATDPPHTLLREIALTLDHLDQARHTFRGLERRLRHWECRTGTRKLQTQARRSSGYGYDPAEEQRCNDRLWQIDRERQHLRLLELDHFRGLHERLGTLLNRWAILNPRREYGPPESLSDNPPEAP